MNLKLMFLYQWFEQKHIKEWMHGVGLQNTLNGLETFFRRESSTTYWIGYDKDIPFAFLITSPEGLEHHDTIPKEYEEVLYRREHGASFVTLNTMDWEALPFYQKLGYSTEFIREGYETNSKMFMLRKNL